MSRGLNFRIKATDQSKSAFGSVQKNITKTRSIQRGWNKGLSENRRAVQQLGFQMTDFGVQIAGGQNAMLAFTQQGGQMLQVFGPAGAIMAAFLTVFGTLSIVLGKTGKSLADITPIMGVLAEDFKSIGRVLVYVRELLIDFANVAINNLDRILITASLVAGFFAGKWVIAFVAARIATFTLAGALAFLRTALIRTGIGALVVGAGELVYQFTRLVRGAGGFGNAMVLLQAVVVEVWGRIGEAMTIMAVRASAQYNRIKGNFYIAIQQMRDQAVDFINRFIGGHVGAYRAIVATFSALPAAFSRFAAQAMNALLGKIERGLGGVTGAMNVVLEALLLPPIPAPDLSGWKSEIGAAVDVAGKAKDAFNDAFGVEYLGKSSILGDLGQDLKNGAEISEQWADMLTAKLGRPIESLKDLMDAMDAADKKGKDIDIRDWFGGGGGDGKKSGRGGGGGKPLKDKISDEAKAIKKTFDDLSSSISSSLSTAFKGLLDRTKSLKDVLSEMLSSILNKLLDTMMDPLWDQLGKGIATWAIGAPGSGGGWLTKLFSGLFAGMSFAGGGSTGRGARQGGMDGRGGFLAMVHPNETITDNTKHQSVGGGGTFVELHVHENASDGDTKMTQSGNRIDVFLRKAVTDVIGSGGADRAMKGRFGLRPQPMGG